ncbi:MAG: type II toxin-antitoxin system VapC family toxin [Deltaproteobacteria bacterium]|nr:type II toxin-antitoxin system VapC family toxin [Deltaproteobacteria bacterium]MBV8454669.1 type II toxin-antitoxin system VapC family toxin [Deltaproteobacteria bacterium]
MIILDTNVLSEILRTTPADSVGRWMQAQSSTSLFTTTICEAEIFYGLALMPVGRRRTRLEQAVAAIFEEDFAERILPFDSIAARVFAAIAARRRGLGRPISQFDAQIAAITHSHGATLATRNIADFVDCEIRVISPWEE